MFSSETKIRVRYGETDRMGYLYYGHYPAYFEVSRTDMIRQLGLTYREIEDSGTILPVRSLKVDYKLPARYDEELTVRAILKSLPLVKLDIDYQIFNAKGEMICTGNTVLVFADPVSGKPKRAPEYFVRAVEPYFK